jgi:hypothetical protein
MKNQNDIIISVVALVLVGIVFLVAFFTKHDPVPATMPEVIETKMPPLPASDIVVTDALPGGQNGGGGGGMGSGPAGMGGMGGGSAPMMGRPGGRGGPGAPPSSDRPQGMAARPGG